MNDAPVEVIESDRGAPDDGNAPADITMTDVVAPIDAPTDAPVVPPDSTGPSPDAGNPFDATRDALASDAAPDVVDGSAGPDAPDVAVGSDAPDVVVGPDAPDVAVGSDAPDVAVGPDAPDATVAVDGPCASDRSCAVGSYCAGDGTCRPWVCVPMSAMCLDPTRLLVCDDRGSQTSIRSCATGETCASGVCRARVCAPGTATCASATERSVCNADGLGATSMSCATGEACVSGVCSARLCTPGSATCSASGARQVCNGDGLGYTTTSCAAMETCSSGTCRPWVCTPGRTSCLDATTSQACAADGLSTVSTPCGSGGTCVSSTGLCAGRVCVPGSATCTSSGARQVCNGDGLGYTTASCAAMQSCLGGTCRPWVCTPSQTTCASTTATRTCAADGLTSTTTSCAASSTCVSSTALCTPWVCTPGAASCTSSGARQVCNGDGLGYTTTSCAAMQSCSGGVCVARVCTPGAVDCGSVTERRVCNADGLGYTSTTCASRSSCRAGVCTPWVCTASTTTCYGNSLLACGADGLTSTTTPCPIPAHGAATCAEGRCGFTCATGYVASGSVCAEIEAPRPVAPALGDRTGRRPALRWTRVTGADGARIQVCRDRACTMVVAQQDVTGQTYALTEDLPLGRLFWRTFLRAGAVMGVTPSASIPFRVGERALGPTYGGDLNGDRYLDLAVGGSGGTTSGFDVYPGTSVSFTYSPTPRVTGPSGASLADHLAFVGDVNGDGYGDLLAGTRDNRADIFPGSATGVQLATRVRLGPTTLPPGHGASISAAGDINNDGYADFIVGSNTPLTTYERVVVYYGGPAGPSNMSRTVLSSTDTSSYGLTVSGAGDVNGDGYDDVLVGNGAGRVYLYFGGAAGIGTTATTLNVTSTYSGVHVMGIGDVNGDGYDDVAQSTSSLGLYRVEVFYGQASGVGATPAVRYTLPTGASEMYWGDLGALGDINGDGYADFGVGGWNSAVSVYCGGPSGPPSTRSFVLTPDGAAGGFGSVFDGVGDINSDGFGDVLVGMSGMQSALLFRGGVSPSPTSWLTLSNSVIGYFGEAVAMRRDRRRDGLAAK